MCVRRFVSSLARRVDDPELSGPEWTNVQLVLATSTRQGCTALQAVHGVKSAMIVVSLLLHPYGIYVRQQPS